MKENEKKSYEVPLAEISILSAFDTILISIKDETGKSEIITW